MCFFGLETCILLRNLDDTSSSRKSFCTAKLGTKLCHTPTWLQLTCLYVCVRACVHERKNNIMMKCQMGYKNCTCPFIQLLETRMILTNNTKLGRTKRSCWRITTGRWWNGIAKILKKEMTMSPRHSPHSPPRTFRRLGFSDVDDHLSDIVLALVQVKPDIAAISQKEIWYYQLSNSSWPRIFEIWFGVTPPWSRKINCLEKPDNRCIHWKWPTVFQSSCRPKRMTCNLAS